VFSRKKAVDSEITVMRLTLTRHGEMQPCENRATTTASQGRNTPNAAAWKMRGPSPA